MPIAGRGQRAAVSGRQSADSNQLQLSAGGEIPSAKTFPRAKLIVGAAKLFDIAPVGGASPKGVGLAMLPFLKGGGAAAVAVSADEITAR